MTTLESAMIRIRRQRAADIAASMLLMRISRRNLTPGAQILSLPALDPETVSAQSQAEAERLQAGRSAS